MTNVHQGLYPRIRRVRRPLMPVEPGTAAPAVVPAKTPEQPAQQETPKAEPKKESVPSEAND